MIAALLLGSMFAVRNGATTLVEVITLSAMVLGGGIVAAAAGKVAGIALSRARWYLERDRLFRRLAGPSEGGQHVVLR